MTLIARPATPGLWIDMSAKPSPSQARAIVAALDPVGVIRTLPLPGNDDSQDLDAPELQRWCALGVQVSAYQHVRASHGGGWDPRNHDGAVDGATAAEHAIRCGVPPGAHIWVDWEDLAPSLPASYGRVYLEAWAGRALAASLLAGEYCGFDDPMSPLDRYSLHGITSYWSDAGHRSVAVRGCAMVQGSACTVAGIQIDRDHLAPDLLGDVPMVCAASALEVA